MKRFLLRVFIGILILSVSFSQIAVFALNGTYHLDELELEVTIPSGYSVITQDTSEYDPIFSTLGISGTELIDRFKTNGIYLNAISNTNNEEIVVTNTKINLSNFSLISDTALTAFASAFINEITNRGMETFKYDIYQHTQAKFIRVYWYDEANSTHGLQYYTVYNGNAMNFTMRSYEGSISSRQESVIKTIVDSIKYDQAPPTAQEVEYTESFIYTDTDSGVKFTVPENWKQEEFYEEREYIDVKFASTMEEGLAIIFSSTDVWSEASYSDKMWLSRKDIDNSMFTKADIAQMCGTTENNVSIVTHNGVEYYKCECVNQKEMYGLSFDITITQLLYVKDGWMYTFQFGESSDHEFYPDFERLVSSVQYPNDYSNAFSNDVGGDTGDFEGLVAVIIVIVFITALTVLIIIYYNKRKSKIKYEAQYIETDINEEEIGEAMVLYCRRCGQLLPNDSEFCHICGTKIDKG